MHTCDLASTDEATMFTRPKQFIASVNYKESLAVPHLIEGWLSLDGFFVKKS